MEKKTAMAPDRISRRHSAAALTRPATGPLTVLLATDSSVTPLVLRLFLGAVIFPHGAQKSARNWGGNGFSETLGFFSEVLGIPVSLAVVVAAEFLGPVAGADRWSV